MTITALDGPIVTFAEGTLTSTSPANQNPESGPSLLNHSYGILDARTPFTYKPGQDFGSKTYGLLNSRVVVLDQVPSAITAANISASATPGSATSLTLVSSSGAGITVGTSITNASTGATVTGLLAIDTAAGSVGFGQSATIQIWDPTKAISRNVRITSGGNDSALTFTVSGYDIYGFPMSEAITGASGGVASGKKAFKYISGIAISGGTVATTASAGTGDVFGYPVRADRFAYTETWWGTPPTQAIGGGASAVLEIPVDLAALANSQVLNVDAPFDGSITSIKFRVINPATTGSKLATLTGQIATTPTTGGVVALTSANCTPAGAVVSGTAVTGANTFTSGQAIGVTVSSVTTFIEGTGIIELTVQNTDVSGGTFTAAVTTTATTTTGDVRGTYAVPSASDAAKRLVVFETISVANIGTTTGIFGVTQA